MSTGPISRSRDLARLRDEGYEIEIRGGYLLVGHVPYLNAAGEVLFGTLVSTLDLAGDVTAQPQTHVAMLIGEAPCDNHGKPLKMIIGGQQQLATGLVADHQFSSKPPQGYADYYEKMTAYVRILAAPAQAIDSNATATTFAPIQTQEGESVFEYIETASSRAGIQAATDKLRFEKVAIVGLGGTGSYVLDLIAKTPIMEIHLFDGDDFLTHNAFRAPGAASLSGLQARPNKAAYFADIYGKMRRGLMVHDYYVEASNVDELSDMDFVFISVDRSDARKLLVDHLIKAGIAFIDVGMGVAEEDTALGGLLRVTACTADKHDHADVRIPTNSTNVHDDYRKNVQVADLNCLNATLAVIKWKKLAGFYSDLENEHSSFYAITGNKLINEDQG